MEKYSSLVAKIGRKTRGKFGPASTYRITQLKKLKFPSDVIEFYRRYEPVDIVEGCVRLLPIKMIVAENKDLIPGCYASRRGFVAFASTFAGDAYCFDAGSKSNPSRIVLLSHDEVGPRMARKTLLRIAVPVATELSEFLQLFLDDALDQPPPGEGLED
ncbi:hypothetical protein CMV30_02980 [Nibricoccus aquaticus]|uniref:Knr4/Smi1-like domain-containing protein n=1 Tax=Nibricoccus aquaticus TaxID=2576891 RepID=A0A290QCD7_9BACT|nr:hypothetical protein CMV30_02920 [Nibricoccus aquaticus]ATC63010.1 hypothetical protein CMV30_02980 [Nibricoccus aquaticus]